MTRIRRKSNRRGAIIPLIIIAIIATIAFVTNPNEARHREAMHLRSTIVMNEVVAAQNNLLLSGTWAVTGSRLLTEFVNASVTTDNYFLFSVTKINWDNQSYSVGFGAFGNVFISRQINKELVEEIIEDARNNIITTIPAFLRIILQ